MNEAHHSRAFGVFKPVGHVVVALPSAADCDAAHAELLRAGFVEGDITVYTPEQMLTQADDDIAHASTLAAIGQELNLVKAHRELAQQGCSFLVVRNRDEHEAEQIAEIAKHCHARRAQRYGSLLIEELIPVGGSERQVAESTDRGLDPQTRSGVEAGQRVGTLL